MRFDTGAVRDDLEPRYDLMSPYALKRLALTYAEGAKKYGDGNWLRGIPIDNLINHALHHIFAFMRGDQSEDHLAHAAWNILAIIHFQETGRFEELGKNLVYLYPPKPEDL